MPKITKTLVDNLTPPEKGDLCVWDSELQGFGVRIQSSGRKVYIVRYRTKDANKTQRKLTLCRASEATPDKARALARDVFMRVAAGEDPAGERSQKRDKNPATLEAMFKARVEVMRSKGRAMAGEVERVLLLAKHNAADVLGRETAPGDVTPADIVRFVSKHYQDGNRGAADKARSYLAATFEWAIKAANDYTVESRMDWGVKVNPAAAVAKDQGAVGVRDRNLSADEIKVVWGLCENGEGGFTQEIEVCLRTIIACGQRVQETLRMCGCEIDLEKKLWSMPKAKTKGKKRDHHIPLPDIIIPDLARLKEQHGDGPLFPSRTGSRSPILGSISVAHAVRRLFEDGRCDMPRFQPRDLRRTWKSRTHDAGVDRFTRDLIQQHAKSDTGSKNYDRADYLPQMAEAMDKWSAWLTKVLSDEQTNVAPLAA